VNLFKAFNFLDAAGNVLIVFSDGDDVKTEGNRLGNQTVDQILAGAAKNKIAVFFVRTVFKAQIGKAVGDKVWQPVVEKTGGKFFAAYDEASVESAIDEIDRTTATGKVVVQQYSAQQPRFAGFALIAAALWSAALLLKFTVPYFNKFP
jgi:hypothetical protein